MTTRNDFLLITTHPNHNSFPKQKWGGDEGGPASWGGGAVDAGCMHAFLAAAAALSRDMRAAVPVPAVAAASMLHSAAAGQ